MSECAFAQAPSPEFRRLRVLIAEDDQDSQFVMRSFLEMNGHDVRCASNGQEAVDLCRQEPFDLVFMDLTMPILGGCEAAALIRQQMPPKTGSVPPQIVGLTGKEPGVVREQCLKAGMNAILEKPTPQEQLLLILRQVLHRAPLTPATPASSAPISIEAFDAKEVENRAMGKLKIVRGLLEIARVDIPNLVHQIQQEYTEQHFDQVSFLAHKLKGMSGNAGAHLLSRLARKLEDSTGKKDWPLVSHLLAEIDQPLGAWMTATEAYLRGTH